MRRYVIIGGGVAGISAAEAIRHQDPDGDLLMVTDERAGFYSRPGLAYYLSDEIPETQLYPFGAADFQRLKLRTINARVDLIQIETRRINLNSGESLPFDRLLIATGSAAAMPSIPGSRLHGVVKLDTLDDARTIIKLAGRGKKAVVVGGGITALEIVEGLLVRRVKTHYFLRGNRYWRNVLNEYESHIVEDRLREDGAIIHYHTELSEILGKRGRVSGVVTKDGKRFACQLVAFAIGVRPNIALAEQAGLATGRGILVDEYLQTSVPGIFAAGDVAEVFDPFTGASTVDSLWAPAREQGRTAGLNMVGRQIIYRKQVAINFTRLAGLTTSIMGVLGQGDDHDLTGIAHGDSETWRRIPNAIAAQSNFDVNHLRLVIGRSTLIGALLMGDQTLSLPLQRMITEQVDISRIRDVLLQPNAPIADIISEFYIAWIQNGAYKPA